MKGSNIISSIHHMRLAQEFMQDFIRERPNAALTRNFKNYVRRFEQIKNDITSEPLLPRVVIDGISKEWNSDVPGVMEINQKVHLLNPDQREFIETVIDGLLKGEEIKIEKNNQE